MQSFQYLNNRSRDKQTCFKSFILYIALSTADTFWTFGKPPLVKAACMSIYASSDRFDSTLRLGVLTHSGLGCASGMRSWISPASCNEKHVQASFEHIKSRIQPQAHDLHAQVSCYDPKGSWGPPSLAKKGSPRFPFNTILTQLTASGTRSCCSFTYVS